VLGLRSSPRALLSLTCGIAVPQNGKFVPEKSNIWRDCVDGYYDWVKEHLEEVGSHSGSSGHSVAIICSVHGSASRTDANCKLLQGAPLNESDHCGDPPLLLAAGNGEAQGQARSLVHSHKYTSVLTRHRTCAAAHGAGHLTCCKLLLDEGADIEQRNVVRTAIPHRLLWLLPQPRFFAFASLTIPSQG
jgi:hypothetical protein